MVDIGIIVVTIINTIPTRNLLLKLSKLGLPMFYSPMYGNVPAWMFLVVRYVDFLNLEIPKSATLASRLFVTRTLELVKSRWTIRFA